MSIGANHDNTSKIIKIDENAESKITALIKEYPAESVDKSSTT